jgi:sugar lactone lactonase YvrE
MNPSLQLLLAAICLYLLWHGRVSASPPIISKIVRGFTIPYKADMQEQIVVDRFDNVYSLDFENNHLAMFDYNGTFLRNFTTDNPPFVGATGVAVDAQLNVYVADQNNQRIIKLDAEGKLVRVYGGGWYNGVAVDSEGFIYVFGDSIFRMDQNGTILQRYNATSYGTRGGLAIDCDGNLLVADTQHARAFRLNSKTGALLNEWTTANPPFKYPWNIAADCAGHVYIADGTGGRVVELDNGNNIVAIYEITETGIGVAISSKGDVLIAPGGKYNIAVMDKSAQSTVEQ